MIYLLFEVGSVDSFFILQPQLQNGSVLMSKKNAFLSETRAQHESILLLNFNEGS